MRSRRRFPDDPRGRDFHRQAELARKVRDLVADNNLDEAARLLDKDDKGLSEKLAQQLRGEVIGRRLADAEEELLKNAPENAEAMAAALLARYPGNVPALVIRGRAHALKGEVSDAFNDYLTGLPDLGKATPATLPVLWAYLELALTPAGERQLARIVSEPVVRLQDELGFANHGVATAADDATLDRVRALKVSMRLHLRAAREAGFPDDKPPEFRAKAERLYKEAMSLVAQHPNDWAASVELARQLIELAKTAPKDQAQTYRDEAGRLLNQVRDRVPAEIYSKRVDPIARALNNPG